MRINIRVLALGCLLVSFLTINASEPEKSMNDKAERTPLDSINIKACVIPDKLPSFVGGDEALFRYMKLRLKYPKQAVSDELEGRVVVKFVVEEDGKITQTKVIRSVDPLLDNEAIRMVKAMPKWKPGKINGKPVRVYYSLPILFKLPN